MDGFIKAGNKIIEDVETRMKTIPGKPRSLRRLALNRYMNGIIR
ncbi:hypothetical protein [Lacrimispora sp.]|nr:hypothetical protein [Lacrimispora sp.]